MELNRFVVFIAIILTAIFYVAVCRLSPLKEKAEGEEKSDGFFDSLNSKGWAALALSGLDYAYAMINVSMDYEDLFFICLLNIILFAVFFYIIYGIMSLMKVSGEDIQNRKEKAFWVNVVITGILSIAALMDKV